MYIMVQDFSRYSAALLPYDNMRIANHNATSTCDYNMRIDVQ